MLIPASTQFNCIIGPNGSGKTTILEALSLLSLGRSFRTRINRRIINFNQESLNIFAELTNNQRLGIEKHVNGDTKLRINRQNAKSTAQLAQALPLQILTPDSFNLLQSASMRRKFLDWGVFHVEPLFHHHWMQAKQALKQRNLALRQQCSARQVHGFDAVLASHAQVMHEMRLKYCDVLLKQLNPLLNDLMNVNVDFRYFAGWDIQKSLDECLKQNYGRDHKLGYTQYGAHKADVVIRHHGIPAQHTLSRGQQKLLVSALLISQGIVLQQQTGQHCIYCIDDLAAELDQQKRGLLHAVLADLKAQVWLTGVSPTAFEGINRLGHTKLFHVKQGTVISSD